MLTAICFNFDQYKILLSGNGLNPNTTNQPIKHYKSSGLAYTGLMHLPEVLYPVSHHINVDP